VIPIEPHPDASETVPINGSPEENQPLFLVKTKDERKGHMQASLAPTMLTAQAMKSKVSTVTFTTVKTFAQRRTRKQREDEERRAEFLQRQAQRRGEVEADMGGAELRWAEEGVKYVRRRTECCLLTLNDEACEGNFWDFTQKLWERQRKAARIMSLIFFVILIVSVFIDGRPLHPIQYVLLFSSLILILPATYISVFMADRMRHQFHEEDPLASKLPYIDYYCALMAWCSALWACGLKGGNVVTNYPSYVYIAANVLAIHYAPQTPWGALASYFHDLAFLFGPTLFLLFIHRKAVWMDHAQNCALMHLAMWLYRFVKESMNRQQYAEAEETDFVDGQRDAQLKVTETVLGTMVPAHVTPALLNWMGDGMSVETQVSREYDWLALSFVYLKRKKDDDKQDLSEWMQQTHAKADEIMKRFPRLTKIKSIGPCIMLAGPFEGRGEEHGSATLPHATAEKYITGTAHGGAPGFVVDAAAEMVQFAAAVEAELGLPLLAGVHIGPVMAAPIGTSRLSFDVFGDTVNTASRVTTTAPKNTSGAATISCSEETMTAFGASPADEWVNAAGFKFGPTQKREAKGKGALPARVVVGKA